MSRRPGPIPEGPPLGHEAWRRVDAARERFAGAWRLGERPAIGPYLDGLGPAERAIVLRELVALEVELRSEEGDRPARGEYDARFPGDAEAVEAAFAATWRPPGGDAAAGEATSGPPSGETVPLAAAAGPDEAPAAGGRGPLPRRLGRYRVLRLLGEGGFGSVYLARDRELGRDVAIKVPTGRSLTAPGRLEALLSEARLAAGLRHPAIVGVHDVGRDDDGSAFIVLEYVEGATLQDLLRKGRIEATRLAGLIADIADAIHHAHGAGLVHRDLKPSNIMIDARGGPRVADFGLAITEAVQPGRAGEVAGTPTHMAPEQVRGEAHRLDGRTDVWALGVILYQGLAGRLPFAARDRAALFDEILHREPRPPRQVDDAAPRELERICLRCLSKRMADRYATALDLAEDLRAWLAAAQAPGADGSGSRIGAGGRPAPARVVPRGLRAFEPEDADFFLDLLPGPRDRHGLPESIRFWKARIEDTDRDATFAVGLLYGPSGCGKTSLVRAGLLPRIAAGIVAVRVDATPDETGPRLLRELRKRLPGLPAGLGLVETFASLRCGDGPKVVVVLDQFEQWLHAHGAAPGSEMVDALRQCDGGRLQAIVMVRDDFAMAAARFMGALDVPIVQGHNFATLDLFDVDHARHILARFGQAFGRLPEGPPGPSVEQRRFLDAVASGLATGGKVVPVRLALFAEMIKGKPWVMSTLEESGGTEGIGVRFLEETFGSRSANPRHRVHERAARDVLGALLPGVGSDIKGRTRSYAELLGASGLADRPGEFDDLLRVLDGELRLITPIDHSESCPGPGDDPGAKCWQLTHDYLVPSLRGWLTRGQKATRRGRAELRLDDLAALWSSRPERRHLPSLPEWVAIRALTDPARWGASQREMMRRAGRLHGLRLAASGLLVASCLAAGLAARGRFERARWEAEADGLVDALLVADVAELPRVAASLARGPLPRPPRLDSVARDPLAPREARLRALYALADRPGAAASRLIEFAPSADRRELAAIRDRVAPYAASLEGELWGAAGRWAASPASLLRIGALLATADPGDGRWDDLAPAVAGALLALETLDLDAWVDLLHPAAPALTPHVREWFFDPTAPPAGRVNAALVLARYADAGPFAGLLLRADAPQFSMLFPAAPRHLEAVAGAARRALAPPGDGGDPDLKVRRNAAIALLRLGRPADVEPHLAATDDPTLRTMVILGMREFGVPPELLLDVLEEWGDPTARQALLLALEPYRGRELPPATAGELTGLLARTIRDGRHQAERAAAEWLLRRWGREAEIEEWSRGLGRATPPTAEDLGGRDWWITRTGHAMRALGEPDDAARGGAGRGRRTALGVHEVTIGQYLQFQHDAKFASFRPDPHSGWKQDDPRHPANKRTIVEAMKFCRWLSQEEGFTEDQMCYPPPDQIDEGHAVLPDDRLARPGYRLPTEGEWERAAKGGSKTAWSCGDIEEYLREFAWYGANSGSRVHPVGMLRPNPFGFFDMMGNVGEWCHADRPESLSQERPFILRGGRYDSYPRELCPDTPYKQTITGYSFTGFRIARTIDPGR